MLAGKRKCTSASQPQPQPQPASAARHPTAVQQTASPAPAAAAAPARAADEFAEVCSELSEIVAASFSLAGKFPPPPGGLRKLCLLVVGDVSVITTCTNPPCDEQDAFHDALTLVANTAFEAVLQNFRQALTDAPIKVKIELSTTGIVRGVKVTVIDPARMRHLMEADADAQSPSKRARISQTPEPSVT